MTLKIAVPSLLVMLSRVLIFDVLDVRGFLLYTVDYQIIFSIPSCVSNWRRNYL